MKYKVIMIYPGDERVELDDEFETESAVEDYALYMESCYDEGGEILNLSNPGDYPLDDEKVSHEIIEVE